MGRWSPALITEVDRRTKNGNWYMSQGWIQDFGRGVGGSGLLLSLKRGVFAHMRATSFFLFVKFGAGGLDPKEPPPGSAPVSIDPIKIGWIGQPERPSRSLIRETLFHFTSF